uniref:Uncharacterized protein n=1 Tax=Anguilla anguilla TaxID=7936 RepID=A0A0E9QUL6_ANGAN
MAGALASVCANWSPMWSSAACTSVC